MGALSKLCHLRWPQIAIAGSIAALLTLAFIYVTVYAYVISYPAFGRGAPDPERLQGAASLISVWGAGLAFVLLSFFAASQVARRAGEVPMLHGLLTGLGGAIFFQAVVYFLYPPLLLNELATYLALGASGGYLGGVEGRAAIAGREAVYQTSRQIGDARTPQDVAAAIGLRLGGSRVHSVSFWKGVSQDEGGRSGSTSTFELLASWTPGAREAWPSGSRWNLTESPVLHRMLEQPLSTAAVGDLPVAEREALGREGIRSVLFMRMITPVGTEVGSLMLASRKRRRFPPPARQDFMTVGTQAALALENLRLVEEARKAGVRAGALEERQRLSREIHDTLAQGFTSIVANLTAAELARPASPSVPNPEAARHLETAKRTARECLDESRRLVRAMRPGPLDDNPLPEALGRLTEGWPREAGVEARLHLIGEPRQLGAKAEVALLRAAQEGLSNVRKHARASQAMLTLSYTHDRVVLEVRDDGVGFDPSLPPNTVTDGGNGGFGLLAMRERAEGLGGSLVVESAPGKGTQLVFEVPDVARPARGGEATIPEVARAGGSGEER
jgi:signal transduction histidine kinase